MAPLDEAKKKGLVPPHALLSPGFMGTLVMIQDGSQAKAFVRLSTTYACDHCKSTMEKQAAKAPSWCIVEFNRGPDPTNRVLVQV